ncbi:MAG: DUF721 domain-containing protein [Verrucomicrobia bacterium]|nr:DUF721 domain-containing protein [Verrucomicrobiota bacterium]
MTPHPPFHRIPPLGPPKRSPRQRVLVQWRGVDLAGPEKASAPAAQPVRDVMPRVLQSLRMDRRRAEAEIVRVWNHLLDPSITAHAQPTALAKGTLFVSVDSNVWLHEIVRYRREEILERLRHSFGEASIRKIAYRVL